MALFKASPSAPASSGVISTTRRPPPSSGIRMMMPRPSLVTSSGPSPVLGFMAAIRRPLSLFADAGLAGLGQPSRRVVTTIIPRVRVRGKSTPPVRPIEAVITGATAEGRLAGANVAASPEAP